MRSVLLTSASSWFTLIVCVLHTSCLKAAEPGADLRFFRERIEPVLAEHCYECHSSQADEVEGSLRLDARTEMVLGGDTGPAVVPGKPSESLLMRALRYEDLEMPPDGRLPKAVVEDFESWISGGAIAPENPSTPALPRDPDYEEARQHWSFQPIRSPRLPRVKDLSWPTNAIDYFVLRQLEHRNLAPVDQAAKAVLIRRVYFDLLGLPPTPRQVADFEQDTSPRAYEELVERLLGSPPLR